MAVFKCKMCGGSLEVQEKMSVCECVYCGTKQTLPRLNSERRANLYDRANHFRRNNEFDKAMSMYEQILEEDKEDAEAYWSLVLCTYGIEYVEDPASHKRLPTVNRTQFISIYADENYKAALQYADEYQRQIYEMEAEQIDRLQKQILSISNQEEPFDVFICYKETDNQGRRTQDSVLANDIYHQLTNEGFKVFFSRITLEDKLGSAYEPYIFAALNSAKVMIVLGTKSEYFNAVWVRNEWSRYLALMKNDAKKVLIPAYKDMDPYDLPQEFSHLQAQDMGKLGFMQDLIRGIKKLTGTDRAPQPAAAAKVAGAEAGSLLKRAFLFMEDGDFTRADEFCERALDIDPENGEAYLGKLMVSLGVYRREDLAHTVGKLEQQEYYHKIMRFGKESLKAEVKGYNQQIIERLEKEKKQRAEQEEQKRAEIYREAVAVIKNAKKSGLIRQALGQLKQISDFRDAEAYIQKAEAKIAKLQKAELMKMTRQIAMTVIVAGILLGIAFLANSIYQKKQVKAQVQELIEQENYAAIYETFSDVLESDAASEATAEAMQRAVLTAMENGEYDKARKLLTNGQEYLSDETAQKLSAKLRNEMIRQAKQWDIILFGSYEQDGDTSNGPEEIEWIVLDRDEEGNLLLFSRYLLDTVPEQYTNASSDLDKCWETSYLRNWMNDTFYETAFSDEEAAYIKPTMIQSDKQSYDNIGGKPMYGIDYMEGRVTEDRVFALSLHEVRTYFGIMRGGGSRWYWDSNADMVDYLEGVCTKMLEEKDGGRNYLLRTMMWTDAMCYLYYLGDGRICVGYTESDERSFGVRPAIWVSVQP